jgi:hypothetical protein
MESETPPKLELTVTVASPEPDGDVVIMYVCLVDGAIDSLTTL